MLSNLPAHAYHACGETILTSSHWSKLPDRTATLGVHNADTAMARVYELEIDTQYLPLSIYTLGVDYTDVSVQVGN